MTLALVKIASYDHGVIHLYHVGFLVYLAIVLAIIGRS